MTTISVAGNRDPLSTYIAKAANGPLVIKRRGKVVAILLVPVDEDDLERLVLARSRRFQAMLDKSRRSLRAGKGLAPDEFWKAVERRGRGKRSHRVAARRRAAR